MMRLNFAAAALLATTVLVSPSASAADPKPIKGHSPAYSPDGKKLAFIRDGALFLGDATAPAKAKKVAKEGAVLRWAPDSRTLAYLAGDKAGVLLLHVESGKSTTVDASHVVDDGEPMWSKDGALTWLRGDTVLASDARGAGVRPAKEGERPDLAAGYVSSKGAVAKVGREEVSVTLPGKAAAKVDDVGAEGVWSLDGRWFFYRAGNGNLMAVDTSAPPKAELAVKGLCYEDWCEWSLSQDAGLVTFHDNQEGPMKTKPLPARFKAATP